MHGARLVLQSCDGRVGPTVQVPLAIMRIPFSFQARAVPSAVAARV